MEKQYTIYIKEYPTLKPFSSYPVHLSEKQYQQALNDSRQCNCGNCVVCKVKEHSKNKI